MNINRLYEIFKRYPLICTDTREIEKNSIFFALKGENFNGNEFAGHALRDGCTYAVIDDKKYCRDNNNYILVDNALETLQKLANLHRRKLNLPVLAITGTNGKTTTKELINAVLGKKYIVFATQGNLNNHIGVPLTILSMSANTDIGVIEMAADHIGEIRDLCRIAEPQYGIITNIGKAHLEGFGSLENVKKAKSELYEYLRETGGEVFINIDNETLKELYKNKKQISYGTGPSAKCRGEIAGHDPYLEIIWYTDRPVEIYTGFVGRYNFENVMAAICVGAHFDVPEKDIIKAVEAYIPNNNRSQLVKTVNNTVIMDAYNANPTSMEAALENFAALKAENKVVILGDMLELGKNAEKEHELLLGKVKKLNFSEIYLIGNIFTGIAKQYPSNIIRIFKDTDGFNGWIKTSPVKNAHILVKGSRGIRLEKVLPNL